MKIPKYGENLVCKDQAIHHRRISIADRCPTIDNAIGWASIQVTEFELDDVEIHINPHVVQVTDGPLDPEGDPLTVKTEWYGVTVNGNLPAHSQHLPPEMPTLEDS